MMAILLLMNLTRWNGQPQCALTEFSVWCSSMGRAIHTSPCSRGAGDSDARARPRRFGILASKRLRHYIYIVAFGARASPFRTPVRYYAPLAICAPTNADVCPR
jgi:hypothetical protein